jgi:hypothetical protein
MRTALKLAGLFLLCLAAGVALLVLTNRAPVVPPISDAEAAETVRPYVIKLHAQWCPVCMVTKDEWADLQDQYAGKVRLVVFDFTSNSTTDRSRAEAGRLGLETVFDEFLGVTGVVVVLDGRSREIRHVLDGSTDEAAYRAAIDDAIASAAPGGGP